MALALALGVRSGQRAGGRLSVGCRRTRDEVARRGGRRQQRENARGCSCFFFFLIGGVERPLLVPLHVAHAAHGLDLGCLGAVFRVVLVLAPLKQVLVATVTGVLITHPSVSKAKAAGQQTGSCSLLWVLKHTVVMVEVRVSPSM